jgi:hypothetical protein
MAYSYIMFSEEKKYSLRSILLFTSMDVSRHILELDTSILMKSNMDRREYNKNIRTN